MDGGMLQFRHSFCNIKRENHDRCSHRTGIDGAAENPPHADDGERAGDSRCEPLTGASCGSREGIRHPHVRDVGGSSFVGKASGGVSLHRAGGARSCGHGVHKAWARCVHGDQSYRRLVQGGGGECEGEGCEAFHLFDACVPARNAIHCGCRSWIRTRELHLPLRTVSPRLASVGRLPGVLRVEKGDERLPRDPVC